MVSLDLDKHNGTWASIIYRIEEGKRIEKQDVIDLLNTNKPVPDNAKPFLVDVISGKYKFKRGGPPRSLPSPFFLKAFLEAAKMGIADGTIEQKKGESALDIIANNLCISTRELERRLKK